MDQETYDAVKRLMSFLQTEKNLWYESRQVQQDFMMVANWMKEYKKEIEEA